MKKPLILSYSGCSTCKKALKWLAARGVEADVRAIVDEPPTKAELEQWIGKSGKPVKKWLNTSGLSYRALGKAKIDAASDAEVKKLLSADGKLVKRPVLVMGETVLVGFKEDEWAGAFPR
ncbi:MAG: Spx/MgsR family RNA polymerase-binding regulatory protein [Archangium sp.]|jgi:arsenate reductase|nr:Spx/MgsR family RNA polymerase-binding regulatory protein [Archangium sp.]